MNHSVSRLVSRIFFVIAFLLAAMAVGEKLFNMLGASMITASKPITLLQAAGVVLLFVISLQLHEIKENDNWRNS